MNMGRRRFLTQLGRSAAGLSCGAGLMLSPTFASRSFPIGRPQSHENLFSYITRVRGRFDLDLYRSLLGSANDFKEGDQIVGIAARSNEERERSRNLLASTKVSDIDATPVYSDNMFRVIRSVVQPLPKAQGELTVGGLKQFLLNRDEGEIRAIMPGLSSDVIACVVKLSSNDELIAISNKVFNPLPGTQIGAKGYLGARIQPNSPTDNVDDIRWQVFSGWSYAVGDVLLGTNPVSSEPKSVAAVEQTLKDILETFGVHELMPHCVLAHIDVQAEVERSDPGSTALWFQSIAGSDAANQTFDISVEKMTQYAASRAGKYGLYFETGQGADFTNGHSHGFDMVMHESRKYGLARILTQKIGDVHRSSGAGTEPWVHVNDVAGFIGPEVFRTREQLVRCCLEDIVMGKLHGLCIGLDVCSTLHMDVSLSDLDWCLDRIMPAQPAYLMALPTKIDPMLGYLTTGFQDHVRIREKFGSKVNDQMWEFFKRLDVIDENGRPTSHFGDPNWVYVQYCRLKGDKRNEAMIRKEGRDRLNEIRERGVFVAEGYGENVSDLEPQLGRDITRIYAEAKKSIWAELSSEFVASVTGSMFVTTQSADREDYILHPVSGERLGSEALEKLGALRKRHGKQCEVQVVVSDGLNALAIMERGQLKPFLDQVQTGLKSEGFSTVDDVVVVGSGRVRAGYRIGELLFGGIEGKRCILHVIGERPGTGHHTFSIYMTVADGKVWGQSGIVDHNITRVVSGVALTALAPSDGASEVVRILAQMTKA